MQVKDYRIVLKEELAKRMASNPRYSLRAFARDLGMSVPPLWRVIHIQQHLSLSSARLVAERIHKTNDPAKEEFLALFEYATSKTDELRELSLKKIREFAPVDEKAMLELETLKVIADWYHIAILDGLALEDFTATPANFASLLGISPVEADLALSRLKDLGLVAERDGKLVKTRNRLITPTDVPHTSIRRFHSQMIQKAQSSLESQSIDQRYISSQTLTLYREDLPRFKDLIQNFFNDVNLLAGKRKKKNALYQVNVQLFDLASSRPRRISS